MQASASRATEPSHCCALAAHRANDPLVWRAAKALTVSENMRPRAAPTPGRWSAASAGSPGDGRARGGQGPSLLPGPDSGLPAT